MVNSSNAIEIIFDQTAILERSTNQTLVSLMERFAGALVGNGASNSLPVKTLTFVKRETLSHFKSIEDQTSIEIAQRL